MRPLTQHYQGHEKSGGAGNSISKDFISFESVYRCVWSRDRTLLKESKHTSRPKITYLLSTSKPESAKHFLFNLSKLS